MPRSAPYDAHKGKQLGFIAVPVYQGWRTKTIRMSGQLDQRSCTKKLVARLLSVFVPQNHTPMVFAGAL